MKPSYCFFNDIKHINLNWLSINKKCIKNTDVVAHEIKYIITQNIGNQNNDNELSLCLSFSNVDAYIIEGKENKYLIITLTKKKQKNVRDVRKTLE